MAELMAELIKASEFKKIIENKKRENESLKIERDNKELNRVIEEFNKEFKYLYYENKQHTKKVEDYFQIFIKTFLEKKDIIKIFKEAGYDVNHYSYCNSYCNINNNTYEITVTIDC